jgi:hypothetical protein
LLSFFFFAPWDGEPPGSGALLYAAAVLAGAILCIRVPGLRFLAVWGIGGLVLIEITYRIHPHWDVARIYLPAGIALCALAAVALDRLASRPRGGLPAAGAVLAVLLILDAHGLSRYYREGRADWRPLARFLASRPPEEWTFTENGYSQLCVAFYVVGPDWAYRRGPGMRNTTLVGNVWKLDGDLDRLARFWPAGETAWLVLGGEPRYPELRRFAQAFESADFPEAEGSRLIRLDPAKRDSAFAAVRGVRR